MNARLKFKRAKESTKDLEYHFQWLRITAPVFTGATATLVAIVLNNSLENPIFLSMVIWALIVLIKMAYHAARVMKVKKRGKH